MLELLVLPYRTSSKQKVDELYALLSTFPHLEWIEPSLSVADSAASISAMHGLRTPDASQAATAVFGGATAFVTNDPVFERVDGFVFDRLLD